MMIHSQHLLAALTPRRNSRGRPHPSRCRDAAWRSRAGQSFRQSLGRVRASCRGRGFPGLDRASGGDEAWGTTALGGLAAATLLGLALLLG